MLKFNLGAFPSEPDPRDFSVKLTTATPTFPTEYRQKDVAIYDQGGIGNCVMQALRSCVHMYTGVEPGATFGYGRWRSHQLDGMYPNEACNGLVKDGIPPVKDDNKWLGMPEAAEYARSNATRLLKAGSSNLGCTWARMYTVDEIKAALMQGVRCIVCLPWVGISNGRWEVDGRVAGYHEMCIIGWTKDGWIVRNSWGLKSLSMHGVKDGYVSLNFNDVFACNDVIALFPAKKKQDDDNKNKDVLVVRPSLRLKSSLIRDAKTPNGNDVSYCQQLLTNKGFPCGTIDGVFGKNSDKAARAFQKANGLKSDGIVGAQTWKALES